MVIGTLYKGLFQYSCTELAACCISDLEFQGGGELLAFVFSRLGMRTPLSPQSSGGLCRRTRIDNVAQPLRLNAEEVSSKPHLGGWEVGEKHWTEYVPMARFTFC